MRMDCALIHYNNCFYISQPFALSANEKRVLKSLSSELFNLIPSTNDLEIADIADIDEGRVVWILILSR